MDPITTLSSLVTYVGDGQRREFTFSFPYRSSEHVFAFVDGASTSLTLTSPNVARLASVPSTGAAVTIQRITPSDAATPIPDGGTITAEMLQEQADVARYIAEEARDQAAPALRFNEALDAYDAQGERIARLADPILPTDAIPQKNVTAEIARIIGGDALAELVQDAADAAAQATLDRAYVESLEANFTTAVQTAEDLADEVRDGPTGAVLVQRITEYLGDDSWMGGGGGGDVPTSGARTYWRLKLVRPPDSGAILAIGEIQFRQTAGVAEQATGGSVVSNDGTGAVWSSASAAFDNATNALGASITGLTDALVNTGNVYIGYVFATARAVPEVGIWSGTLAGGSNPFRTADIQVSDDGSTWTTIKSIPDQGTWAASTLRTFATDYAGSHRYWRIRVTRRNWGAISSGFGQIEFRTAYGVSQYHSPGTDGNVLSGSGGSAWTSPSNAFDEHSVAGNTTTAVVAFNALAVNPTYIGFQFTAPRPVTQLAVTMRGVQRSNAPREYIVQYSDDGTTWVDVQTIADNTAYTADATRVYNLPTEPSAVSSETVTVFNASGTWEKPARGRMAYVQAWGAGGANCGGGGGYSERFIRLADLSDTTPVTVGDGGASLSGADSSFGSLVYGRGGALGTASGGHGGNALGPNNPPTGEGLGGSSGTPPTGGIFAGGGGNTGGSGAASVYGGGGGGSTTGGGSAFGGAGGNGTAVPTAPGGGGGPSQPGAKGRVTVSVF